MTQTLIDSHTMETRHIKHRADNSIGPFLVTKKLMNRLLNIDRKPLTFDPWFLILHVHSDIL